MEKTYVDVSEQNNLPLPTKEAYLAQLKKLDLNIPAKFAGMILGLDQIAGAFYERRVPLNEIGPRAQKIVETSVQNLESAFAEAREAEEPAQEVPRYDPDDPYARTVEEAEAELSRLRNNPNYLNADGKVEPMEHDRLVALANRLRAITMGQETSLRGYVDGVTREREERHVAAYGSRESKHSATGLRSVGSEGMGEGPD